MVRKKSGEWRPCRDYRRLNTVTIPDRYPVPFLQNAVSFLHGTSYLFSYRSRTGVPTDSGTKIGHPEDGNNNAIRFIRIPAHDFRAIKCGADLPALYGLSHGRFDFLHTLLRRHTGRVQL